MKDKLPLKLEKSELELGLRRFPESNKVLHPYQVDFLKEQFDITIKETYIVVSCGPMNSWFKKPCENEIEKYLINSLVNGYPAGDVKFGRMIVLRLNSYMTGLDEKSRRIYEIDRIRKYMGI
jgi:hypothetical protein